MRLHDIKVRAPDRFRWSRNNELLLRTWQNALGAPVPDQKFWVVTRPGEHGDTPYGPGLARWCYWPAWLRRHGHRFWATTLERFGAPLAKGRYPKGDLQSKEQVLRSLQNMASGSGIALPEGQDIEIMIAAKSVSADQSSFAGYMDKMISKVILGQSSTTEQGPWRGTAEVQKDVRDEVVASDCRLLDQSFMRSIATWLTGWNYPGAAVPIVMRDASPSEDIDARATREGTIHAMTGLRPTLRHVEQVYGGEWESAPAPIGAPGEPGVALAQASPRDEIDAAVTALLAEDGWEPYLEPIIGPPLARVEAGDDLDGLRNDLASMFAQMDADDLVTALRRMSFSANLSGQTPDIDPREDT